MLHFMNQIRQGADREISTSRQIQMHHLGARSDQHRDAVILERAVGRSRKRERNEIPAPENRRSKHRLAQHAAGHAVHRKHFELAGVSRQVNQGRGGQLRAVRQTPAAELRAVRADGGNSGVSDERAPSHVDVLEARAALRRRDDAAVADRRAEGHVKHPQRLHAAQVLEREVVGGIEAVQAGHGEHDEVLEVGQDLVERLAGDGVDVAEVEQAQRRAAAGERGGDVFARELCAGGDVEEPEEGRVLAEEADRRGVEERGAVERDFFEIEAAVLQQDLEAAVVETVRVSWRFCCVLELAQIFCAFGLASEV